MLVLPSYSSHYPFGTLSMARTKQTARRKQIQALVFDPKSHKRDFVVKDLPVFNNNTMYAVGRELGFSTNEPRLRNKPNGPGDTNSWLVYDSDATVTPRNNLAVHVAEKLNLDLGSLGLYGKAVFIKKTGGPISGAEEEHVRGLVNDYAKDAEHVSLSSLSDDNDISYLSFSPSSSSSSSPSKLESSSSASSKLSLNQRNESCHSSSPNIEPAEINYRRPKRKRSNDKDESSDSHEPNPKRAHRDGKLATTTSV